MPTKRGMTLSPLTILPQERGKTTPQTKKTLQRAFLFSFHFIKHLSNLVCGAVFLLFLT